MDKRYGSAIRQDSLDHTGRRRWELFYGFGKDDPEAETGYNYHEVFDHQPTAEEVKATIIAQINANTDEKILSGYSYQGMQVWLSSENQFNYKAAYDLAVQTGGETLPTTFKFGTDAEPQYYTFETLEELGSFVKGIFAHINEALQAGWQEKDSLDVAGIINSNT